MLLFTVWGLVGGVKWLYVNYAVNGYPKCEHCGKKTRFKRKQPSLLCNSCYGKIFGFGNYKTQEKINQSNLEKYNVIRPCELDEIKNKISISKQGVKREPFTQEWKDNIGKSIKLKWQNSEYRNKTQKNVKIALNAPEQRKARQERAKKLWKDPQYIEKTIEIK